MADALCFNLDGQLLETVSSAGSQNLVKGNQRAQSHTGRGRESICLSMSTHTWKHSPRRTTDSRTVSSSISSRARQIKDYEAEPFLSVNLLPHTQSSYQTMKRDQRYLFHEEKLSPSSSSRPASIQSLRRGGKPASDFYRTFVNMTRPISCISLTNVASQPNLRVKMPFKHATSKSVLSATFVVPAQAMIEDTALAVDVMKRIFLEQPPSKTAYRRGRLLKARLKCLEPVTVQGPDIYQCRGIVAETRSYSACSSRTLSRMSRVHTPKDMMQSNKNSVHITESVHRTSEASSPDPAVGVVYNLDADLSLNY